MIEVEIWSDFACPFCYIGKRHFEEALSEFPHKDQVHVVYKSFELDPSAPKSQKETIYEVLAKKYGRSLEWAESANENVVKMAAESGLQFHMDKVIPTNSFDAHRLSQLALQRGKQIELQERIFSAYFTEGKDIASPKVLAEKAAEAGLDSKEVDKLLQSNSFANEVRSDESEANQFGVQGVPFFVFNRQFAVSGAQPTDVFLEVLDKAASESTEEALQE